MKVNSLGTIDGYLKSNNKQSTFGSNRNKIAFTAQKYPSGHYSDWFIASAKQMLPLSDEEFVSKLESNKDFHINRRREEYLNLRIDLKNEQLNKKLAKKEYELALAKSKVKHEESKFDIKQNQLAPKFCNLIQKEKAGESVNFPNIIILDGSDEKLNRELIEWTGKNSGCRFIQIENPDDLAEYLKLAKKGFQNTGDRTLLHVKNLDKFLTPQKTPGGVITDLTDIMASAANDYNSTIIFSAQNAALLDPSVVKLSKAERIDTNIRLEPVKMKAIPTPPVEPMSFDEPEGLYSGLYEQKNVNYVFVPDDSDDSSGLTGSWWNYLD